MITCGWTRMRRSSLRAGGWHDGDSHGGAVLSSGAHTASPPAALALLLYLFMPPSSWASSTARSSCS
jgi:hypothetical protein